MLPIRTQALVLALLAGTSWLCPVAKGGGGGEQPACKGCAVPAPGCKTCIPVPDLVKVTTPVYGCRAIDFCLPKRSLLDLFRSHWEKRGCGERCVGGLGRDCASCRQCECQVRRKMVLLKRTVTTECPSFKCEPVGCPAAGYTGHPY